MRYILTKHDGENAWEQINIHSLAEFLFAVKKYSVEETISFIKEFVEAEDLFWDEPELREILERVDQ